MSDERAMSIQEKLKNEIKEVTLAALYVAMWIGILAFLKGLLLAEYRIQLGQHDLPVWRVAGVQRAVNCPATAWDRRTDPAVHVAPSERVEGEAA
jgi:hypothetical protein